MTSKENKINSWYRLYGVPDYSFLYNEEGVGDMNDITEYVAKESFYNGFLRGVAEEHKLVEHDQSPYVVDIILFRDWLRKTVQVWSHEFTDKEDFLEIVDFFQDTLVEAYERGHQDGTNHDV